MNTWLFGKNSVKYHYQKKKILQSLKYDRYYWCRFHTHKKEFEYFEMKSLREYHDLHVQSNILLLADVFKNF